MQNISKYIVSNVSQKSSKHMCLWLYNVGVLHCCVFEQRLVIMALWDIPIVDT